jgi:hypothetical protein
MGKDDMVFLFGAILALCGTILTAPMQQQLQQQVSTPGVLLLFFGIIVMMIGLALKFGSRL